MKIASVDVIWCGCAGEASIATDSDATDVDAGKALGKRSDFGQMGKSVMVPLRKTFYSTVARSLGQGR